MKSADGDTVILHKSGRVTTIHSCTDEEREASEKETFKKWSNAITITHFALLPVAILLKFIAPADIIFIVAIFTIVITPLAQLVHRSTVGIKVMTKGFNAMLISALLLLIFLIVF